MNALLKQHLIDPEICIRCHTCEEACPIGAITHDDNNVVVDAGKCNFCMACISPCPTGSIDHWRVVETPYSLDEQLGWSELPVQAEVGAGANVGEAMEDAVKALLASAHAGAGGAARAPLSAAKPSVNVFSQAQPAVAVVQGNFRLTAADADADVRHIILDFGAQAFPVLEGQSIGILAPGVDAQGRPHHLRLYSVSSPRDGEKPNRNNLSLTVKREETGVCSNYICDLKKGDEVRVTGPFGTTFLMPEALDSHLVMICTGTGSAPFRAFTMRRQRVLAADTGKNGGMALYFGARTPQSLPYFGPLAKVPDNLLQKHFAFSRVKGQDKHYVQDIMRQDAQVLATALQSDKSHIYICGLKAMEAGVEQAFEDIARGAGLHWQPIRDAMRESGRYHVETY
ncbi:MAG: benzoyl-CoA 2,3-epoxidase subunit BoxA [Hyphomicrobiales bacterium]|nr:benzoyl-CoA 2,3-epoxidase subunit BoxA [Hyphomicrobiales bacterium]MDE2113448.1 benzoyl-CoA 2,3-epoxidase subunit BoxA [Hyphomicrobiales bacterium]